MGKTTTIIFLLITIISLELNAQSFALKKADKFYENMAYSNAIVYYKSILKKDSLNNKVIERLADSYFQMDEYDEAYNYYKKLNQNGTADETSLYRYSQLLVGKKQFSEAGIWLKKYLEKNPNDRRAKMQLDKVGQLDLLLSKVAGYKIKLVEGNTRFIDMCPVYYKKRLVFSSSRDTFSVSMKNHSWNDQPFLDLYITSEENSFVNAPKFSDKLNSRFHDGPVCFSSDGRKAYFTRNNFIDGKLGKDDEGVNNLKLLEAILGNDDWEKVTELPWNSNDYSVGHAALSPDDKTLYFASNMPGSYGETDIFKSTLVNESWSEPVNLGPLINTEGREMFPYVDSNGVLYFASDGLAGIGGLDIYAAIESENGEYFTVNLGSPINSGYDDFGLIVNTTEASGYFTSNRPGGIGNDDIYNFSIENIELIVTTLIKESREILPQAIVYLETESGEKIDSKITNKIGETSFEVKPGKSYRIIAEKANYLDDSKSILATAVLPAKSQNEILYLERNQNELTIKVIDKSTGEAIPGAKLDITINNNIQTLICANGVCKIEPIADQNYECFASARGYFGAGLSFSTVGRTIGDYSLTIELEKIEAGKTIILQNIYYDLNKWNIRPDAAVELDKVVRVLKENPEVKVELSSHTDCRASVTYNMKLSQQRAESAVDYLVEHGINRNRLVPKGYGETQLLNKCADGVWCSENEHQMNRRTELKVLKK